MPLPGSRKSAREHEFAQQLELARRQAGLTTAQLSEALYCVPRTVRRYLNAERRPPRELVVSFEKVCGVRPGYLTERYDRLDVPDPAQTSPAPIVASDDRLPYRGLRPFGEEDSDFFFGRDREIESALAMLENGRFLAVVGPSGSGKSSLVGAGIVPRLRAGALTRVDCWHVLMLRPGAEPLTALAAQLSKLLRGQAMQRTLDALEHDVRTLHLSVELALADCSPSERVLLVLDQLEEVFTLCRDDPQRRQLFSLLSHAASSPAARTVVIATMRSDFYGRCAAYPELARLVTGAQLLIGSMDADGLRQAIEEPARCVGVELEEGLADTILGDVAAEPGALPLLEHALLELWDHRDNGRMTFEGYRRVGGVKGALAQRADTVIDELSQEHRELAQRVLLRLTQPGDGTEDTRRRVSRTELVPAEGDDDVDYVLDRLVDARLLTTGRDEAGSEVVDVSHEALIRGWPRLRQWIDADRAGLVTHRRLTDAAGDWETLRRDAGALYRGARLASAREWAAENSAHLSQIERAFLEASETAERGELVAAKRGLRRLRILALGLLGLTAVVAAVAMWAFDRRTDAKHQAQQATALALASSASAQLERQPDVALLLALEANRASERFEARTAALRALMRARISGHRASMRGHAGDVLAMALSPDGQTLASGSEDGAIRLWNMRTHELVGSPMPGHNQAVWAVAFSPDGQTVASGGQDGTIRFWAVHGLKQQLPTIDTQTRVSGLTYSPDGRMLASGGEHLRLWDASTHRSLGPLLTGHSGHVTDVAFSPDGRTLASAGSDRTVRLWDPHRYRPIPGRLTGHTRTVDSLAFSPDGRTLATAGSDRSLRLWDLQSRTQIGEFLRGFKDDVLDIAFSGHGRTLASVSVGGTIRLWVTSTRKLLRTLRTGDHSDGGPVVVSPDGHTLASSDGALVRVWDLRAGPKDHTTLTVEPERIPALEGGFMPRWATDDIADMALSPNGLVLASAGGDRTVRLWSTRTRRQVGIALRSRAGVNRVAFSPDGRILAAGGPDGAIELLGRGRRQSSTRLPIHDSNVEDVEFSPDGRTLASVSQDKTIRVWDVRRRTHIVGALMGHGDIVQSVAFAPDGRTLASGSWDRTIRLWDARTFDQVGGPLTGHEGIVYKVAFSPNSRVLASAGGDGTIRLWDRATRKPLGVPLAGHDFPVVSVAFSPDGHTLASASIDKTILLWDVDAHEQLGPPLEGHQEHVTAVAFDPGGRTLWSAANDGTIRLWQNHLWRSFEQLRREICPLVSHGLTRTEWARYATADLPYNKSCPR